MGKTFLAALLALLFAASSHGAIDRDAIEAELAALATAADQLARLDEALAAAGSEPPEERAWLLFKRARALEVTDGNEAGLAGYEAAWALLAALPPSALHVDVLLERSYMKYLLANVPEAYCADREEAVRLARQLEDPKVLSKALVRLTFCQTGDFSGALETLSEAIGLADARQLEPNDAGMVYNAAGNTLGQNQLHDQAYGYLLRAYDAWAEVDDRQDMFNMQHALLASAVARGAFDDGEKHVARMFEMADESPEFEDFRFFAHYNEGLLRQAQGRFAEAGTALGKALALEATTQERYFVRQAGYLEVAALYRAGQTDAALERAAAIDLPPLGERAPEVYERIAIGLNQLARNETKASVGTLLEAIGHEARQRQRFVRDAALARGAILEERIAGFEEQIREQEREISGLQAQAEISGRRIALLGAAAGGIAVVALIIIVAILLRSRQVLTRQARTDELTGIANRAHGRALANEEIARAERSGVPLSLLVFDVDHFKRINDSYGHAVGDQALQQVARIAGAILTADQPIARMGGEEFMVLLPGFEVGSGRAVAERLRTAIEETPLTLEDEEETITISIGLAAASPGKSLDHLLHDADEAMYTAKASGRNRVQTHDPEEATS
ncbi:MAG: GGDEF domain-containing protein [Pseudomonadota bacterium]